VAQVVDKCLTCMLPYDVDMSHVTFITLADPNLGRLKNPGITWSYVPKGTPLGPTSSPPPPPPSDTPLPPPARRSFGEPRKRSPAQSDRIPPHDRRMVKRHATARKSDTGGHIEPRSHLAKTDERAVSDPVRRRDVPQSGANNLKKRTSEDQNRKSLTGRRTMPLQLPSLERRMIKVALFSK
jgi:hypothetical protein